MFRSLHDLFVFFRRPRNLFDLLVALRHTDNNLDPAVSILMGQLVNEFERNSAFCTITAARWNV